MKSKSIIFLLLICILLSGCKEKTFKVTFDTMGGSLVDSINLKKGSLLKNIKSPSKEGYLFVSWLKDGVEYNLDSPITEDITLTANWIEAPEIYEYYEITFIVDGQVEKVTVKENETVKPMNAPEKEGYNFLGWYSGEEKYDFNKKITKDIALTAKYELNVVTVTYDLDGGFGIALETITKNTQVSIPEIPTKQGYKFLKWTLNGKEFSFDTKIDKDITLKAEWSKIEYVTVIFDTDGGSGLTQIRIEKHSKINNIPTPTKQGYIFKEWQLDGESFDIETPIEKDINLKAIYIEE